MYLNLAIVFMAVLFFLPAVYYSLLTPFALIDDYSDWLVIYWLQEPGLFIDWFRETFINWQPGRFRPFFQISNFAAWFFYGNNSWLHHLSRLCVKGITVFLAWYCLANNFKSGRDKIWDHGHLPLAVLLFISLFFPNHPEARLAPQELHSAFFIMLLNISVINILNTPDQRLYRLSWPQLSLLYAAFIGLFFAKEINIAVLAWFLIFLVLINIKNWKSNSGKSFIIIKKEICLYLVFILIFLYAFWRIKVAVSGNTYGTPKITLDLIISNYRWLVGEIFQIGTSRIISTVFILLLMIFLGRILFDVIRRARGINRRFSRRQLFLIFLLGQFLAMLAILATTWYKVYRFWYPLVPVLALIYAMTVSDIGEYLEKIMKSTAGLIFKSFMILFLVYFLMVNYANHMFQFINQHNARNIEVRLLDFLLQKRMAGKEVVITNSSEFESKIIIYFNQFQKYFFKREVPVKTKLEKGSIPSYFLHASRGSSYPPFFKPLVRFRRENQYNELWPWVVKISALAQMREKPLLNADAGAQFIDNYIWYVYYYDKARK